MNPEITTPLYALVAMGLGFVALGWAIASAWQLERIKHLRRRNLRIVADLRRLTGWMPPAVPRETGNWHPWHTEPSHSSTSRRRGSGAVAASGAGAPNRQPLPLVSEPPRRLPARYVSRRVPAPPEPPRVPRSHRRPKQPNVFVIGLAAISAYLRRTYLYCRTALRYWPHQFVPGTVALLLTGSIPAVAAADNTHRPELLGVMHSSSPWWYSPPVTPATLTVRPAAPGTSGVAAWRG